MSFVDSYLQNSHNSRLRFGEMRGLLLPLSFGMIRLMRLMQLMRSGLAVYLIFSAIMKSKSGPVANANLRSL